MISAANDNLKNTASPRKLDLPVAGQKKIQSGVRTLRGHTGAVTALHCVTRREVWDLVGDREDAGFFISGSTDCTVTYYSLVHLFCFSFILFNVIIYLFIYCITQPARLQPYGCNNEHLPTCCGLLSKNGHCGYF